MAMSFNLGRAFKGLIFRLFGFRFDKVRRSHLRRLDGFFERVKPVTCGQGLVRVGGAIDGGYLVCDDFAGIRSCFSPGVSAVADFEKDLIERGIACFLADYSVAAAPFVHPLINFEKKFLGYENDDVFMTLEKWVGRHAAAGDNDLILQMDIEGAEYDVILSADPALLRRFRIIVIEFHNLDALFQPLGFKLIDGVFRKLRDIFEIVHIHPNNCNEVATFGRYSVPPVMEFTFLRKDRALAAAPTLSFPHPLDRPNLTYRPDIVLPGCWYGAT